MNSVTASNSLFHHLLLFHATYVKYAGTAFSGQVDYQLAFEIVNNWLRDHKASLRDLASLSGVDVAVLSRLLRGITKKPSLDTLAAIYSAIKPTLSTTDCVHYLGATGLLSFAQSLVDDTIEIVVPDSAHAPYPSHEAATRILNLGLRLGHRSWYQAIPFVRQAESLFGPYSSQAPRAICYLTQLYINLGDYRQAHTELERAEREYAGVIDPETRFHIHRLKGWVNYYAGDFQRARLSFSNSISLGEELGSPLLLPDPLHFIGRIERDVALRSPHAQTRLHHLSLSEELHARVDTILYREKLPPNPMWQFRASQTLVALGKFQEAAALRDQARHALQFHPGVAHIDVEDGHLALADGQIERAIQLAERALGWRSNLNYAKGLSDALHLLALAYYVDARFQDAFETALASACIYQPVIGDNDHWDLVLTTSRQLQDALSRRDYRQTLQRLYDAALERRGPFRYLDCVIVQDQAAHVTRVFSAIGLRIQPVDAQ